MMFLHVFCVRKRAGHKMNVVCPCFETGKHLLRTHNVSEENIFCVTKFVSAKNVACANGETFVSATMCSRLAGPLNLIIRCYVESFFRTPNS